MNAIRIYSCESAGLARRGEIATAGVPLPQGMASPEQPWCVRLPSGERLACQTTPLASWPDGSVQWMTVRFPASIGAGEMAEYDLAPAAGNVLQAMPQMAVTEGSRSYEVNTGPAQFRLPKDGATLLEEVRAGHATVFASRAVRSSFVDRRGIIRTVELESVDAIERGPLVVRVRWSGHVPKTGLLVRGEWTFRVGSACAELNVTLHNPSRARHTNGCWDLGDPGSVLFRSFSMRWAQVETAAPVIRWREQLTQDWQQQTGGQVTIGQFTSGGQNDRSRNHVNRNGQVPACPSGYTVKSAAPERTGRRAAPLCSIEQDGEWIAAGIHEFWQQFPKSLTASGRGLEIGVFPDLPNDLHELQGGEQKTTRVALALGSASAPDAAELLAVVAPLEARCDGAWMASTGAIWRLPRQPAQLDPRWHTVAKCAASGERGFFGKREAADEYGWRNFGDLWADHEEAYYKGPQPIVSHYNNQYDALEGFLLSYLLTGDRRFWELADPLARHVIDIDIYHTTQDKAAYNGGQFWHTNHYRDGATATHRAYSATNHPAGGGGPSNEQNYSSGLLLYYHLTGNEQAREAVIGLADWVLNMDDGRSHVLGLLHESPTGLASQTTETSYHSPGRGAGNSINTLLDGWVATARPKYLHKVEELVSRTIHPHDDIAALDLGNAELRWSYAVFLQTLVRCLAMSERCQFSPDFVGHLRASLLHYARWMAEYETFYLDQPEKLEFPTETWAAQEIRKANILTAAGHLADDKEALQFRERAAWFADRAWTTLLSFPTWHFTRPTVLALQLGLYAALLADPACLPRAKQNGMAVQLPTERSRFVPQREAIRRGLCSPGQLLAMLARSGRVWRWRDHFRSTWAAQRVRGLWRDFVG